MKSGRFVRLLLREWTFDHAQSCSNSPGSIRHWLKIEAVCGPNSRGETSFENRSAMKPVLTFLFCLPFGNYLESDLPNQTELAWSERKGASWSWGTLQSLHHKQLRNYLQVFISTSKSY